MLFFVLKLCFANQVGFMDLSLFKTTMIKFSVVQTGVRIKYPNLDAKTKVMTIFLVSPGERTQVLFLFKIIFVK